ncbi:MAG: aminotransferase class V-fold PLP-dependent enzyme [bacterium]|nr:aminotransferase class V-fold PLP-dependent enzyme [bacterium]
MILRYFALSNRTLPKMSIYLNNAASGWPLAPGVLDAMEHFLISPHCHSNRSSDQTTDVLQSCRDAIAHHFRFNPTNRVILLPSATYALNIAVLGCNLGKNDVVVVSAAEHNSLLRPLFRLQEQIGIVLKVIPLNSEGNLCETEFERAIALGPKLVALTHASNVTGRIFNVQKWFLLAKLSGATTLLDAAQTAGLVDVTPSELSADLTVFAGHKCFHGPPGIGGLLVGENTEIQPILTGGTGIRSNLLQQPPDYPTRLECGTPNLPAIAGLHAAVQTSTIEIVERHARIKANAKLLRNGLTEMKHVSVLSHSQSDNETGVISFLVNGWEPDEVGMILQQSYSIVCRTGLHCAPLIHNYINSSPFGTVRFSISSYNTSEEIAFALDAVDALAK